MARIYDNIDIKFEDGLRDIIESPSVKRVDFCVGYFNLRGWKLIVDQVDNLPGDFVDENGDNIFRCLLYTSPSPRDRSVSRMPSSA